MVWTCFGVLWSLPSPVCEHLVPPLHSGTLSWELDIRPGGNIYTVEIGKRYSRAALPLPELADQHSTREGGLKLMDPSNKAGLHMKRLF